MKIVVLAGGISTERDVSFNTGKNVYTALKAKGHDAIILDVYLGYTGDTTDIFEKEYDWTEHIQGISEKNPDLEAVKALRSDGDKNFFGPNVLELCKEADVVFMALHGENGENGKIQATFDLMGITYTGTDYLSSAICMDKALTKDILASCHVPTPRGTHFTKDHVEMNPVALPCVVKACCGGSSVGVSIAHTKEEYEAALEDSFQYDNEVVVEEYVKGREFSVGVIDGKALPIIEIQPKTGFYDYKNKYQAGAAIEICPAQLTKGQTEEMQGYAEEALRVLRLRNYARIDFMMNEHGDIYCLEANTLPGMTATSLLPQEAKAVGISFEDLCQKIVDMALEN